MPTVSAGDLLLLRADGHKSNVYTSFLPNIILWEARINDVSIVQGETSIDFDAGTGSFFSLIEALQEIWVGSAAEENDVGRLRIKSISSGDGGVTGTVTVAGHSFPLQDDDYLTFHHNYPLKPRYSWVDPATEIWYMDDDVVYTDQHEEPPPIVIAGPHRGGFLVSGSFVINVNSSSSYAVAAGASISSYALTVASTAGTPTVNFNTGTGLGDITFTNPGYYWAKYTVTDSNGKSQVSYRCYFVCEKDRSSAFHPFVDTESIVLTGDWETGGWIAGIEAKDGYSLDDIPFHTLCVIWRESWYGATKKAITFLPDSATTIFAGYVRGEVEEQDFDEGLGHVDLVLSTVEGRLRRMYSFSASIVAQRTTVNHWSHGPTWMTVGIIAAYLLRWRSTIFEVTDVLGLKDNDWKEAGFEPDDNNLYDMVNNYTLDEGIRAKLICDMGGRLIFSYDNQLLTDSERSALLTTFDIKKDPTAADYGGSLIVARAPEPEAPFVTSNGIYWDGNTWDEDDRPEATGDWCVIAPGGKPLHEGPNPMDFPAQIIPSLDYLKQLAGRYLAKANNEIEEIRIAFSGDYLGVLDPAYDNAAYTMSLQASDMPRGVAWNAKPLYLRNVTARYSWPDGLFNVDVNASFEPESAGITGVETQCPSFPILGGEIPEIPIPDAAPGALLTGSSVHQKLATENAWLELHTEDVDDLIVDPFWKLKTSSFSPSDAIVFRSGLGYIERSTDGGVTFSDVTPTTDPPNDSSDSPAPTVANVRFNRLDASFTSQHEFVALCTWQNASSEWRTWIYHTDDNFATNGTWQSITSGFGPNPTWDTPTVLVTNGGDGVYPQNSWTHAAVVKGIAALTPTKFVVCFRQDYGDPGDNDYSGYARIVDVNPLTGTIVVGAKYGPFNDQTIYSGPYGGEVHGLKVFAWDSSHFVILTHELQGTFWPPNETCDGVIADMGWSLLGYVGSVSDQIITFGDPQLVQNEQICCTDDQETQCRDYYPFDFDMSKLPGSNNHGIIISSEWLVGQNLYKNPGYAWVVLVNGGTRSMTVGDFQQWESCPSVGCRPSPGIGCSDHKIVGLDSANAAIFFNTAHDDGDGIWQAYVKHVTVSISLLTCTFGSPQWLEIVGPGDDFSYGLGVAKLTANKFVLTFDPTGASSVGSMVVARDDDTYTVVSQGTVNGEEDYTPWYAPIPVRISDTMWAVVWIDWDGAETRLNGRIGYETSPTAHAYGTRVRFDEISDEPTRYREFASPGAAPGSDFIMAVVDDEEDFGAAEDNIRVVKLDLPIDGYETKGLGISFGKGLGNRIWVTVWSNTNGLELINIDLPSVVENGRYGLGAATEAQVNAKSLIAYPFNAYGNDDICLIYGRMDSPQDSDSIEHVIVTQNGGISFASVENGWGADHAGALYFSAGGIMFVMRNRYNQSKLYKDKADSNLILKSTMPFEAQVAPHGMYVNPFSGDVFAASWAADPVMVAMIAPPYFTARDLTYDHDNSEGVQSIVEL